MANFKDKVIVITGAGSGIGRALAERLAREQGIVFVTDRDGESARAVAENIERAGGKAESATLDVVDADAVQHRVDETVRKHGRLDYMFNNAGIGIFAEAQDHTLEDWNRVLDINLRGVIHGVQAAYPVMRQQGFGHIVNTASLAGLIPAPNEIAYVASKYAIVGLTATLRVEAEAYGVKASVICPGYVDTPILFEHTMNKYVDKMGLRSRDDVKQQALGLKAMNVDDAAAIICKRVAKNQAMILVTRHAKVLYSLQRFFPSQFPRLVKFSLERSRKLYQ
jgi:NAD(P)-dependent dehydrogenase (short-subunit alcohol dehydrogenase family)